MTNLPEDNALLEMAGEIAPYSCFQRIREKGNRMTQEELRFGLSQVAVNLYDELNALQQDGYDRDSWSLAAEKEFRKLMAYAKALRKFYDSPVPENETAGSQAASPEAK